MRSFGQKPVKTDRCNFNSCCSCCASSEFCNEMSTLTTHCQQVKELADGNKMRPLTLSTHSCCGGNFKGPMFSFRQHLFTEPLYCIVWYPYIYIALLEVHITQKCFQCERLRESLENEKWHLALFFDCKPLQPKCQVWTAIQQLGVEYTHLFVFFQIWGRDLNGSQ